MSRVRPAQPMFASNLQLSTERTEPTDWGFLSCGQCGIFLTSKFCSCSSSRSPSSTNGTGGESASARCLYYVTHRLPAPSARENLPWKRAVSHRLPQHHSSGRHEPQTCLEWKVLTFQKKDSKVEYGIVRVLCTEMRSQLTTGRSREAAEVSGSTAAAAGHTIM